MIFCFINAEKYEKGIAELAGELNFQVGDNAVADVCISVQELDKDEVIVELQQGKAIIGCGKDEIRFYRGLGLLCEALAEGKEEFYKKETPAFTQNGSMFDVARNMVLRPEMVKAILRKQAIMGLNFFMLYLEDVFQVPEYPYFGHMRGRYSKEEIREMDAYARIFGIELVPAIQCLGHIAQGIKWEAMADLRDTHDTMMVGREAVYTFIDKMMAAIKDCFSTRRLHIGLDESNTMGGGRYREHGEYKPQYVLFCEHLDRIREIGKKYDFELMMWSDMFFFMTTKRHYSAQAEFDPEMIKLIPRDVQLVYWKYCVFSLEENEKILQLHYQLSNNVSYAGGIQTWLGAVPLYDITIKSTKAALGACMRNGVKEVMATIWCNGGESCMITALYGLMIYAEMDYNKEYDEETIKRRFRYICGVEADDIIDLEKMNHPDGKWDYVNTSKYLLYNDPLIGLMDKNVEGLDVRTFYENLEEEFKDRGTASGLFAPAFRFLKEMLHVLTLKADYGIRLKKAYDHRNMEELHILYEDAQKLEERYDKLRRVARDFYLYYNKPFGQEVVDMRLGTLQTRFETVRYHLDRLFEDETYRIPELEEERMYLIAPEDEDRVTLMEYDFGRFYSAGQVFSLFYDFMIG